MLNHVTDIRFMYMCNKLFLKLFFVAIFILAPLGKILGYVSEVSSANDSMIAKRF